MTIEDIEKAAMDYTYKEWARGGFKRASQNSFIAGAEWRIKNVWHDASEEPTKFCDLLLIKLNNGEFDLGYEIPAKAASWAYVKDLLPIKEG